MKTETLEKKVIFVVQGYDRMEPNGNLFGVTTLEVFAKNEEEAIKKSKKYITKSAYRVSQIIEK